MSHKVHSSQGNVPFSWENKPGVSKKNQDDRPEDSSHHALKLPPPPCPPPEYSSRTWTHHHFHELQVPLPPCGFRPPSRSGSSKGLRKQDDPFLSAYLECTKSSRKGNKFVGGGKSRFGFGFMRNSWSVFSCKNSCSTVRDDRMVRISHLPISRSEREG
ncbi:hypothetical protein RHMOL_Rhmol06G0079400 [Rhododendron molle]|uniref:Uncharacterized protein n=1 Tax=Rhododendron molle TaxID=49168 RepID=A0ACC0N9X7_RHOML|nr:hypothetical protein RHMOL_Rhmol06G0079400 [Rhododendron molle]